MTPKEKAFELWLKFRNELDFALDFDICRTYSRRIAILAVDEIIKALPPFRYGLEFVAKIEFWNEVKQEIQKL